MFKHVRLDSYRSIRSSIKAAPLDIDHQKDILDALFYQLHQDKLKNLDMNDLGGFGVYTVTYTVKGSTEKKYLRPGDYLAIFNDWTLETKTPMMMMQEYIDTADRTYMFTGTGQVGVSCLYV